MEEKLEKIFDEIATDESVEGQAGRSKIMEIITDGSLKFPDGFTVYDINSIIESIEIPSDFSKESFVSQYNEIVNLLKQEIIPDPEVPDPDDEEVVRLTGDFIAERLSDLQQTNPDELSFALTSFAVSEAEIVDISALSSFNLLFYISLKTNSIYDASPLNGLQSLKELNLSENKLISFDSITLPSLEVLNLSQNRFCSVSNLCLPKLKRLDLSQNQICYLSPNSFAQCVCLEELDLSQNKLNRFRPNTFEKLTNLKILKLDQNQLSSIPENTFNGLENLENINIGDNSITTIEGFNILTSLKIIDMHGTAVEKFEDLAILADLKNLNTIIFDGTPVQSSETFKSDIILMLPWLETIDEEAITFADRQEALDLEKERKEQEEAERREREEAERLAAEEAAAANDAAEGDETETTENTTEETEETEGTMESTADYTESTE